MEEIKKMAEITWPEFSELMKETDIALIPVGTLEEHGHHLPLGTDAFSAENIAARIAKKVKCIILPPILYGNNIECWNTSQWPGSINISSETLATLERLGKKSLGSEPGGYYLSVVIIILLARSHRLPLEFGKRLGLPLEYTSTLSFVPMSPQNIHHVSMPTK